MFQNNASGKDYSHGLNSLRKSTNNELISKFSAKIGSMLSSFPLETNMKENKFYHKNISVSAKVGAFKNSVTIPNEKSYLEMPNQVSPEKNIVPLLPDEETMDRMELTLKLNGQQKLSDSDESLCSNEISRSNSRGSLSSSCSTVSSECIPDEGEKECHEFMKIFTAKLFANSTKISYDEKAKFGEISRNEAGRRWFSRYLNSQRVNGKCVNESTFYSLIQYFSIMLFECSESDDFSPAKSLMNMAFTFYFIGNKGDKEFLFKYLKSQPIWHSLRFWNAAFFEAVQSERENKPMITSQEISLCTPDDLKEDEHFQENITFGQLVTFTFNMHSFGLSKKFCLGFLRKQTTIANLSEEQDTLLVENVNRMFKTKHN